MRKEDIIELLKDYTYSFVRPNVIPNSRKVCDCSLFVAWYIAMVYTIPSILTGDICSWNIYASLVYSGRLYYEGPVQNLDFTQLKNGDVVIFSNLDKFNIVDPNAYWCGIYWDENSFLNFNEYENLGTSPLSNYMYDERFTYRNVAVLRIRNISSYSFTSFEVDNRDFVES